MQDYIIDSWLKTRYCYFPAPRSARPVARHPKPTISSTHGPQADLPVTATIDGFGCEECYGRVGSKLTLQFGYDGTLTNEYVKYFKVRWANSSMP